MTKRPNGQGDASIATVSCKTELLLLAALERGGSCLETGRYLISYRDGQVEEGIKALQALNFRIADARDFSEQAVSLDETGDAEALVFPELAVALVGGDALQHHGMDVLDKLAVNSPIEIIEPEYFAFLENSEYLRGFLRAATTIARDMGVELEMENAVEKPEQEGRTTTWGVGPLPSTRQPMEWGRYQGRRAGYRDGPWPPGVCGP
ncbi:hypothetical protein RVM26_05305 [Halomonas sp. KM072]